MRKKLFGTIAMSLLAAVVCIYSVLSDMPSDTLSLASQEKIKKADRSNHGNVDCSEHQWYGKWGRRIPCSCQPEQNHSLSVN
ncbi:MAG: hypothetical protein OXT74_18530 [Candidatus Poribacteria bacterium]|nr:hypothetical protein [Candidatus Poribacteria bacterium]